MEHVSTESSWPMTLIALGGPPRSQSKCHTNRAPSISHSKEECPCAADGKEGWVPTVFHSPTKIANCLSEPVGCGGCSECFFMLISLSWSCLASLMPSLWKKNKELALRVVLKLSQTYKSYNTK